MSITYLTMSSLDPRLIRKPAETLNVSGGPFFNNGAPYHHVLPWRDEGAYRDELGGDLHVRPPIRRFWRVTSGTRAASRVFGAHFGGGF
jgi:hypothetical protein